MTTPSPPTGPPLPSPPGATPAGRPRSKSRATVSRHTKAITIGSVLAVSLAALFAIGANLGILHNSDDTNVGTISAASDLLPAGSHVVDVYLDQQGHTPISPTATSTPPRTFQVDEAGTVTVSTVGGHARVDSIDPGPGWTAEAVQASGADVAVSFTDGTRTLEFIATAKPDGTVTGDVTAATDTKATRSSDDDHDSHHESDDNENDHDGGDDDD